MELESMERVMYKFEMPGCVIPRFKRRSIEMARLGVYNIRIHAEQVVQPLLRYWKVADMTGLSSAGSLAQEHLLALPDQLLLQAEHFEARMQRWRR